MGDKVGRVLFLKDYASYIKDEMIADLSDFPRNLMLSIDILPIPTDEAVREVQSRILGIETDITRWQQRQNDKNNFTASIPYELEQLRGETKEFLSDLTERDQRMILLSLHWSILRTAWSSWTRTPRHCFLLAGAPLPIFHPALSTRGRAELLAEAAHAVQLLRVVVDKAHDRRAGFLHCGKLFVRIGAQLAAADF